MADVFSGAPQESSAASFGTQGMNFRARKPREDETWQADLPEVACEITPTSNESKPYAYLA